MAPMDIEIDTPNAAYTILRIKRKRNDEPLDVLSEFLLVLINLG
jgi:hypothetical protein